MKEFYMPMKLFKRLCLFFPLFFLCFVANATTYYLTAAGAGSAQTPANWNTNPAGGGTAATNFTTNTDIFIIPVAISGTFGASVTFGSGSASGSGVSLQVLGTMTISNAVVITLNGKNANNTSITISGTIIFGATSKVSLNDNDSRNKFILLANATLKTANVLGVVGTNCSIERAAGAINSTITLTNGANYEFNGTASQFTAGLPTTAASGTINALTVNNAAGVNLTAGVSVSLLTVGNVTTNSILNDNGKQITSTGTFALTSGTFNIGTGATATSYPGFTTSNIAAGTTVNYNSTAPQTIAAVNYANLTNTANGNRTLSSTGTIGISGMFSPGAGTYTTGTSTVSFNGTLAQTIPTISFSFYNLKIDNAAGISSIGSNITVTNSLALTNGVLTTGANKIIIPGGGASSRTNGWINGNLQKYIASTGPVNFEIGDANNYSPVIVDYALLSTAGNLTATVTQGIHPSIAGSGLSSTLIVNRYWNLTPDASLAGTYSATFGFNAGDILNSANWNNFVIRKYSASVWNTTISGTKAATSTQATGLTGFGEFAIAEYSGLPTVSSQPVSTAVCLGSNAGFTSASSSSPAPAVQWQRSDDGSTWVNITSTTDGSKYSNFLTNSLAITAPGIAMNGYQYRSVYTNINGTVNSNAVTLTVTDPPVISTFNYPTDPFADITSTAQLPALTGTNAYTGGAFTSDAGLTINSSTGGITPNASTLGNHTIVYTIAAAGGCGQVTASAVITITTAPTANISYIKDSFCITDNGAYAATLTGTGNYNNGGAGYYSVNPASGLIVDAATGAITPNGIDGTYTVTYHIPAAGGFPASTTDKTIVIVPVPTAIVSYTGGPFCTSDQTPKTVTLTGTGAYTGGIFSTSPAGLVLNTTTGEFTPNGSTGNTTYTVTYTIPASGGCAAVPVNAAAFDIVQRPTASIAYNNGNPLCQAFSTPQPVTITGASGGTFSASPAGLTINTTTGEITPSSSVAGDYDITYTIPASGPCGVVQIVTTITIAETPSATIDYPLQPYCTADPQKTVSLSGTGNYTGGTFSSAPGLTIDPATGTLTPATTTPNTYTVTYTAPFACPVNFTAVVEINGSPTANISYPGSPFCITDGSGKAVNLTGSGAYTTGSFSASPAGLSIDPTSGDITPSTSSGGTYTVTYTIPGSGNCAPVSTTASVTITPAVGTPAAITINGGTEPGCQLTNGTTTTTYLTSAANAASYNWSLSNPAAGSISSGGVMTWANAFSGTVDIQVTANGCNGISGQVNRTVNITPTVSAPVFAAGSNSVRCQGAGVVNYTATAANSTAISYSLDASSLAGGNTISSVTGDVTFAAGWSGTSTVTASAAGCNGPVVATHTVTITPTAGTPVFALGAFSVKCQGATTVTYTATATNTTGITYSLDGTSTAAGNTIDGVTGAVTFTAGWNGTSVITASAAGCNGPVVSTHTITVTPSVTINPFSPVSSTRCQGAGTVTVTTTGANTTGITYSLDAASLSGGNTINASSGLVTFVAGWSGATIVTASAAGCNGPVTTTHTVTVNAASTGGSLSPSLVAVCSGGSTGTMTLSGQTGSVVRWEKSINAGGTWTTIANTAATYSTAVTQSTLFRVVVQNGVCGTVNSSAAQVVIDAPFTPTVTASVSPVCLGGSTVLTASGYTSSGVVVDGGDFSSANPPGWNGASASNNSAPANAGWGETNGPKTFNGQTYSSSGKFMIIPGTGIGSSSTDLTTPVFSLAGLSTAYLAFNQAYNLAAGAQAQIRISMDGGTTYTTLQTYTGAGAAPGTIYGPLNGLHTTDYVDLTPYLGMTNLKIQFLYTGVAGSNWALDNIVITNSTSNPTGVGVYNAVTYTWSPAANLSSITGQSVTLTPAASGSFTYNVTTTTSAAGCVSAAPGTVTVTVNPVSAGGTLPSNVSVCAAGTSTINLTGNTGSVVRWERSTNNGVSWTNIANTTTTLNASVVATTTLYRALVQSGVCPAAYSTLATAGLHNYWTGATSTDWQTAGNWSDGLLPSTSCADVVIQNVTNKPVLSSGTSVITNLIIQPSAAVTINGAGLLTVGGSITSNGTFDVSAGSLEFNGTAAQNIAGAVFTGNSIKNMRISNTSSTGLTITTGALNVTGDLDFGTSNATLTTNDNLVLRSTATTTARVADITKNGAYTGNKFVGKVTVERFYPGNRSWRLITAPLSQTGNIFNSWQNGGNYVAGKGMFVTGLNPNISTNGLDNSIQNNFSMKGWNGVTNTFTNVADTRATLLSDNAASAANVGYFTFVRGDRSRTPDNTIIPNTNNTTLSSTGFLQTGTQTFPAVTAAGGFTLIGNPYASPVDFSKITRNNVINRFFAWDPQLNDVGGFVVFDDTYNTGTYTLTSGASSPGGMDTHIQSSQAFFVQTTAAGPASVVFNEANKSSINHLGMFRPASPAVHKSIRVKLQKFRSDNTAYLADGLYAEFDDAYSAGVETEDAPKFSNINETLGLLRNEHALALERRPSIKETDTLFLKLTKSVKRNYRFQIEAENLAQDNLAGFVEDQFLGRLIPVNLEGNTTIDFDINDEAASAAANRFKIIFRPSVVYTEIKAGMLNRDIAVEWTLPGEYNIKEYEIERSADGVRFTKMGKVSSSGNSTVPVTYQWIDVAPVTGEYYYRIRSISYNDVTGYSNQAKVTMNRPVPAMYVFPNPVTGNHIQIQMNSMPQGVYAARLMNNLGQVILNRQIVHGPGTAVEKIQPDKKLLPGLYHLEVIAPDKTVTMIKVNVQ